MLSSLIFQFTEHLLKIIISLTGSSALFTNPDQYNCLFTSFINFIVDFSFFINSRSTIYTRIRRLIPLLFQLLPYYLILVSLVWRTLVHFLQPLVISDPLLLWRLVKSQGILWEFSLRWWMLFITRSLKLIFW